MADAADFASELEEQQRAASLAAMQATAPATVGEIWCVDCDGVIPHQRRKIMPHATRCVECQSIIEAKR